MFKSAIQSEKKENYINPALRNYFRPTKNDRIKIRDAFRKCGIEIYGNGYDLIENHVKENIDNLDNIIHEVVLYELKSHGKNTKYSIDNEFNGFSFGVTENEIKNCKSLKDRYKIIFLNNKTDKIKIQEFSEIEKSFSHASYFFKIGKNNRPVDFDEILKDTQ